MAGGNLNNEPAPWEAPGKRHTQMYGAGSPPQSPAPPSPPPYPSAPSPYPAAPQAVPYPQSPAYPPGPQAYPPQQPYGAQSQAMAYPMAKPNSGLAIASLVCAGVGFLFGLAWPVGIVLGVVGLKQTKPGGTHTGRGLAVAGTIINSVMTVLVAVAIVAFVALIGFAASEMETMGQYTADGNLIVERADMYRRDHGDLSSGGHCFVGGYKNEAKAAGGLRVEHLVGANELKLPIDRYTLEVSADGASVWYQEPGEEKQLAGRYRISRYGSGDFSFDDWDPPPPPPRKR